MSDPKFHDIVEKRWPSWLKTLIQQSTILREDKTFNPELHYCTFHAVPYMLDGVDKESALTASCKNAVLKTPSLSSASRRLYDVVAGFGNTIGQFRLQHISAILPVTYHILPAYVKISKDAILDARVPSDASILQRYWSVAAGASAAAGAGAGAGAGASAAAVQPLNKEMQLSFKACWNRLVAQYKDADGVKRALQDASLATNYSVAEMDSAATLNQSSSALLDMSRKALLEVLGAPSSSPPLALPSAASSPSASSHYFSNESLDFMARTIVHEVGFCAMEPLNQAINSISFALGGPYTPAESSYHSTVNAIADKYDMHPSIKMILKEHLATAANAPPHFYDMLLLTPSTDEFIMEGPLMARMMDSVRHTVLSYLWNSTDISSSADVYSVAGITGDDAADPTVGDLLYAFKVYLSDLKIPAHADVDPSTRSAFMAVFYLLARYAVLDDAVRQQYLTVRSMALQDMMRVATNAKKSVSDIESTVTDKLLTAPRYTLLVCRILENAFPRISKYLEEEVSSGRLSKETLQLILRRNGLHAVLLNIIKFEATGMAEEKMSKLSSAGIAAAPVAGAAGATLNEAESKFLRAYLRFMPFAQDTIAAITSPSQTESFEIVKALITSYYEAGGTAAAAAGAATATVAIDSIDPNKPDAETVFQAIKSSTKTMYDELDKRVTAAMQQSSVYSREGVQLASMGVIVPESPEKAALLHAARNALRAYRVALMMVCVEFYAARERSIPQEGLYPMIIISLYGKACNALQQAMFAGNTLQELSAALYKYLPTKYESNLGLCAPLDYQTDEEALYTITKNLGVGIVHLHAFLKNGINFPTASMAEERSVAIHYLLTRFITEMSEDEVQAGAHAISEQLKALSKTLAAKLLRHSLLIGASYAVPEANANQTHMGTTVPEFVMTCNQLVKMFVYDKNKAGPLQFLEPFLAQVGFDMQKLYTQHCAKHGGFKEFTTQELTAGAVKWNMPVFSYSTRRMNLAVLTTLNVEEFTRLFNKAPNADEECKGVLF